MYQKKLTEKKYIKLNNSKKIRLAAGMIPINVLPITRKSFIAITNLNKRKTRAMTKIRINRLSLKVLG